ncbi:MAG TPA: hypothetical protein VGG06_22915 [Thermoanaerobaculia bacterium]|jgi:hypothetical protein
MGAAFSKANIVNALISATVGTVLTLIFQPLVAQAQGVTASDGASRPRAIAPPLPDGVEEPPPPPPVLPPFDEGVETDGPIDTINVKARGKNNSVAYLRISILDAEHYWPLRRADTIVGPGGREENAFLFLDSSGLRRKMEKAKDIVAIGMSSCENERTDDSRLVTEESRAGDRAQQLINWVRRSDGLPVETQLYTVNIGQYQDSDCHRKSSYHTRHQRNAILVSIVHKENIPGPKELGQLLKAHLIREDRLNLDVSKYSKPEFILNRRD